MRATLVLGLVILMATVPVCYAQNAASEEKKSAIMEMLDKGDETRAFAELEDILASHQFNDLKEWAQIELYNRAQAEGKLAKVIGDLEKYTLKDSKNVVLQRAIAEGYLRQRNFNKVVSIYEALARDNPDDGTVQTRLTDYYILAKQFDRAIERLEPIVNANPDDNYNSDILLNAYTQARMEDKALAILNKRLAKDPESPGLRGRYAQALQDFGMLNQSAKEWEKASELDPQNLFFRQRSGEVYAASGDSAKAKQQFQKVINSASGNQAWLKQKAEEGMANLGKKK